MECKRGQMFLHQDFHQPSYFLLFLLLLSTATTCFPPPNSNHHFPSSHYHPNKNNYHLVVQSTKLSRVVIRQLGDNDNRVSVYVDSGKAPAAAPALLSSPAFPPVLTCVPSYPHLPSLLLSSATNLEHGRIQWFC